MTKRYSVETDRKWQKRWEETGLYRFDRERVNEKLYCLEMFSYPSGKTLHVGHWYNYSLADSWARMKRMQGHQVFHPMGFDAFGLPAENYAIKTGIHPEDSTRANVETMERQLREMGATFDWDYEVITCDPDYYRWTQWLFIQLYKKGLAYRDEAPVNWCPACNTVLANEQVVNACCERCDTEVTRRDLTQWFFKITDYADELLAGLDRIDWPETTKAMQRNWIGRSEGSIIRFQVDRTDDSAGNNTQDSFEVFTTRPDTLFGVSYAVLAPEHRLVDRITTDGCRAEVEEYRAFARKQTEVDRLSTAREKTGVFTGAHALHPLTGQRLPIWIADYVLSSYGTGAVMAVPGHDTRDFEFAEKYDLPIPRVIKADEDRAGADTDTDDSLPYTGYGVMVNSGSYDGLTSEEGKKTVTEALIQQEAGRFTTNYRLRDWLVSRQRYWGAPIPMIHCGQCGVVPVPEEDLPVRLPYDADFKPSGESPLATSEGFINTVCPTCGKPARRDPDTLDTFVDSSWYFVRYPDNKNDDEPWDVKWINKMLPVDKYVGGQEHACMHLLYARFITKALRDLGHLDFDEPFLSLIHQGMILGPDGKRMSKSRGNTILPDSYIKDYGSDVFRLYLGFGFAYTEGGAWDDDGIKATHRFVGRVERWIDRFQEIRETAAATASNTLTAADHGKNGSASAMSDADRELNQGRHHTIKGVTEDAERFQFNTSISRTMELVNALYRYDSDETEYNVALLEEVTRDLLLVMAPFAPHFTEEMWERLGYQYSIFNQQWPGYDESALVLDTVELAVQVNGRVRSKIVVEIDASDDDIKGAALSDEGIKPYIEDEEVRRVIVIRHRLVNIVV